MRSLLRFRFSTMLLLVLVVALLLSLFMLKRSQTILLAEIARFRDPKNEAVADIVDQPLVLTYADGAPLEQVLKEIRLRSTDPAKLPRGIPIYVDPIGLSEAEKTMASIVKKPPGAEQLTLREHLKRVLKPLGLGFTIKSGFLMITSDESLDEELDDPYLGFRDVLE